MKNIAELPAVSRLWYSYLTNYKSIPKPRVACIEVSYLCNARCIFCKRWKVAPLSKNKELSTGELFHLIKSLKLLGIKHLNFSGGEPLLRKDILKAARYAKSLGISTMVNTNGLLINESNIKEIAHSFNRVTVSLDTLDEKKYSKIRGVNGLQKALHSIGLIAKYKKPRVKLVLTTSNLDEVENYLQYFMKKNVEVSMQPVHSEKSNLLELRDKKLNKFKNYKAFKKRWMHIIKKYNLTNSYYSYFPEFLCFPASLKNKFICFAGSFDLFIDPYGNVFPCESRRDIKLGNIRNKPLSEIWKKDMQRFRKWASSNKRDCMCWWSCTAKRYLKLSIPFKVLK